MDLAQIFSPQAKDFISIDEPVFAVTNVVLIDGTGNAIKTNQTIVVRDGKIESYWEFSDNLNRLPKL